MAKHTTLRSFLLSMAILSLLSVNTSCKSSQTILIPRYPSGADRASDPLGGDVFRIDRTVDGQDYSLMAVCIGDTLILAAQVHAGFVGDVTWRVGECQLDFALPSTPPESEVPIKVTGDLGINLALVGKPTASEDTVTIRVDVPRRTLAKGEGALVLNFVSRDGSEAVVLPASGWLRGIYLMQ